MHNHGKNSHVSVITDILFERNGSQSSVKDVEEMKSQASGSGGFELTIVIVGVCAWLSTPASSNPHSAVPCDAVFLCCSLATLADTCGRLGYQQI